MRKDKEKRTKETNIGKIIYGFLLFMPLIAIFSSILINTFNMKAKTDKEVTYKYETNEVNTLNDIQTKNVYHLDSLYIDQDSIAEYQSDYFNIIILKCQNLITSDSPYIDEVYFENYDSNTNNYLAIYVEYTNISMFTTNNDGYTALIYEIDNTSTSLTFTNIEFYIDSGLNSFKNYCFGAGYLPTSSDFNTIESVIDKNTENTFYRAVEQVEQSNLFNWSKNSIIYTGIENTCQQLSITNTFIPMLMAYWLIISVIYILYDIILLMLILFHRKVHELQDTI